MFRASLVSLWGQFWRKAAGCGRKQLAADWGKRHQSEPLFGACFELAAREGQRRAAHWRVRAPCKPQWSFVAAADNCPPGQLCAAVVCLAACLANVRLMNSPVACQKSDTLGLRVGRSQWLANFLSLLLFGPKFCPKRSSGKQSHTRDLHLSSGVLPVPLPASCFLLVPF